MTRVIAAIDNSAAALPVLETASGVALLYRARLDAVHFREDGDRTARAAAEAAGISLRTLPDDAVDRLIEAGDDEDVVAMVIGARSARHGRRPAGHVALQLIVALRKPLIVVPPQAPVPFMLERVLVPLDGTRVTAAALQRTIELAYGSDVEVVALHVHDEESLPLFSDQPQHELESWTREFLARYCPCPERVRLEVRVGVPGEHVLRVAEEIGADLIALGWAQDLSPGRAAVVREALERSEVALLLVPVLDGPGQTPFPASRDRRTRS